MKTSAYESGISNNKSIYGIYISNNPFDNWSLITQDTTEHDISNNNWVKIVLLNGNNTYHRVFIMVRLCFKIDVTKIYFVKENIYM